MSLGGGEIEYKFAALRFSTSPPAVLQSVSAKNGAEVPRVSEMQMVSFGPTKNGFSERRFPRKARHF